MEELKVWDWVRYTRVDDSALRDEGEIGQITSINEKCDAIEVSWVKEGVLNSHNRRYLVKIQPPEKEKTMDIRRKVDGFVVRGVIETYGTYGWYHGDEYTTTYYRKDHWEPVEEWVTIEVLKRDWDKLSALALQYNSDGRHTIGGFRWRTPQ